MVSVPVFEFPSCYPNIPLRFTVVVTLYVGLVHDSLGQTFLLEGAFIFLAAVTVNIFCCSGFGRSNSRVVVRNGCLDNIYIYIYLFIYLILKIVHIATQSFMQFRNLQATVITSSVLFVDATH